MPHYFAYGSNMSRARLEKRVGEVVVAGWATLQGYRHAFSKRGNDGSGKGNIEVHEPSNVHGVLYQLDAAQLETLHGFEYGYRAVEVEVLAAAAAQRVLAVTYESLEIVRGLIPSEDYLQHYRTGMDEHRLPDEYIAFVLASARGDAP